MIVKKRTLIQLSAEITYINVTENLDYEDMIDSYCERYQDVSLRLKEFGIIV